jgi:hypothetical protein
MENNQIENTATEAAASQAADQRLMEAQAREIAFLQNKLHSYHDNVHSLMNEYFNGEVDAINVIQ